MQGRSMNFYTTKYEGVIDRASGFMLQLTFKKLAELCC